MTESKSTPGAAGRRAPSHLASILALSIGALLAGCTPDSLPEGSSEATPGDRSLSNIPAFPLGEDAVESRMAATAEPALRIPPQTSALDLAVPDLGARAPVVAKQASGDCVVGFHNQTALLILPDQAKFTFASNPWYIEPCGLGWVRVMENPSSRYGEAWGSDYGHYHLGYQRGAFCITGGGQPGIMSGSSCVAIADPTLENRVLGSHSPDHWIRLYVYEQGPRDMTFSIKGIRVKEGADIQLWFRQVDGDWRVWRRLGPNKWGLPGASGIREVLISGAAGATAPFFIDDIVVSVP